MPLLEVLRTHPRALVSAGLARIGVDVAFYIFVTYILAYVTGPLGLERGVALNAVLIGSAFQLFLIPLFGALSDRVGRRRVYLAGVIGAAVWVFAFFPLLDTRSFPLIALASIVALACHAAMYGPQAAFIAELFSTRLRYSGASMGYQFGSVLAGGIAPLVAVALLNAGNGEPGWVILYFSIIGIITVVATLLAPETLSKLDRRITAAEELDEENAGSPQDRANAN